MSSIDRPLSGTTLIFDLHDEGAAPAPERSNRTARTLVKSDTLRVTLVAMGAGGETAEHHADGPITIQVLTGRIRFEAQGHNVDLRTGQLLYAEPGLRHRVSSAEGGRFLLTVAQPNAPQDQGTAA